VTVGSLLYYATVTAHLLAALLWLGGMFFLAIVGAPVLRSVEPAALGGTRVRRRAAPTQACGGARPAQRSTRTGSGGGGGAAGPWRMRRRELQQLGRSSRLHQCTQRP
jgi:hypothetical protein